MTQDRWKDVKSRFEGLGLKLKLHLEQEEDDDRDEATGEAGHASGSGAETDSGGRMGSTKAALDDLGDRIEDAFEAFGNAAKDPAVRADVREIGLLLRDAVKETVSNVGSEVSDSIDKVRNRSAEGDAGSGDGETPFKDSPDDDVQDDVR